MGTGECLPVVLFLHFHIVKIPETSARTGWKLFSHIITWRMSIFFPSNKTFGEFDIWGTQREAGAKKPLGNARTSKFTSGLNGPPNGTVAHGAPTVNWNVIEIAAQPSAISQPQQLHFLDKGKETSHFFLKRKKKIFIIITMNEVSTLQGHKHSHVRKTWARQNGLPPFYETKRKEEHGLGKRQKREVCIMWERPGWTESGLNTLWRESQSMWGVLEMKSRLRWFGCRGWTRAEECIYGCSEGLSV